MGNMEAGNDAEACRGHRRIALLGAPLLTFMARRWEDFGKRPEYDRGPGGHPQRIAIGVIVVFSVLLDVVVRRGALEKRRISPRKREQDVAL